MSSRRRNRSCDDGLATLILALMFMPVAGVVMCCSNDCEVRDFGKGLLVISAVIYGIGLLAQLG